MSTVLLIVFIALLLLGPVALLERTHRRTERLSRMPFGFDVEGDRDITRTLAEIKAIRAGDATPLPRSPRLREPRVTTTRPQRAPRQVEGTRSGRAAPKAAARHRAA